MWASKSDVISNLPIRTDSTLLDIGFGIGQDVLNILPKNHSGDFYAIEIDNTKLQTLQNKYHELKRKNQKVGQLHALLFDVDKGNKLPFKPGIFDIIILSHTLRHIIYRESLLKECIKVLKPGGIMLVVESKADSFGSLIDTDNKILVDEMLEYLDNAGFVLAESFDTKAEEYGIICIRPNITDN